MLEEVEKKLRESGYEVESYTDWIKIDLTEAVEIDLNEDGSSEIDLGEHCNAPLNAQETQALNEVLTIFTTEMNK